MLRKFLTKVPKYYFSSSHPVYAEHMYQIWKENPNKVDSSWQSYFEEIDRESLLEEKEKEFTKEVGAEEVEKLRQDVIKLYFYIRSYNKRGHELANLDPLSILIFSSLLNFFLFELYLYIYIYCRFSW